MATKLLTEKEVAAIYNLNIGTLQNHRITGRGIPFVKIGRRVFYREEDIENFIKNNCWQSITAYEHAKKEIKMSS